MFIILRWGTNLDTREGTKCKLVCEFFDLVMLDNSHRAALGEVPLDFKEAKERWEDVLCRNDLRVAGASQERSAGAGSSNRDKGRNSGNSSSKAKGTSGAVSTRPKPSFSGKQLCYDYNRKAGCRRTQVTGGCKDSKGAEYAHVCNYYDSTSSKYCYVTHSRETNH